MWTAPVRNFALTREDGEYEVKQESYFYYLFGVKEVGFYATIDIDTGEVTLFSTKVDPIYRVFMVIYTKEEFEKKYGMKTLYTTEMEAHFAKIQPVLISSPSRTRNAFTSTTVLTVTQATTP